MSTTLAEDNTTSDLEPWVANAVNFLNDVSQRGFKEIHLRKYLLNNRGLTTDQVDEAFRIHYARLAEKKESSKEPVKEESVGKVPVKKRKSGGRESPRRQSFHMWSGDGEGPKTDSDEGLIRESVENPNLMSENNTGDRPERATWSSERPKSKITSIFLPEKQEAGDKLIKDFLVMEKTYCAILKCLKEDYYKGLAEMAQQKKFLMTRKEVDEIFFRVPQLWEFHKAFYNDMSGELNIGRIFVRLFNFFKRYVAYMKDCTATINKMRGYTRDTNLHACLERIRERSMYKGEDMIDLLLVPLKRISEYKEFLEQLHKCADMSKEAEYDYLGKASRRIGRVATYINKYKDGISNRNEMNKIQQFLGTQCDILAPYRRIVRRGMMIRRTTGWAARNKHYIFFLFNDVLLWTSTRGDLKNVIHLSRCEVLASDAKYNPERKFRIISRGQRYKTLLLECESVKQRDEWFVAVEMKVSAAKVSTVEGWTRAEFPSNIAEENSEDDEVEKEEEERWGERKDNGMPFHSTASYGNKSKESAASLETGKATERKDDLDNKSNSDFDQSTTTPSAPLYHHRYQLSHNFKDEDFQGFEPLDDTVSVVSEYDESFYESYKKYGELQGDSTTALMSPFCKKSSSKQDDDSKHEVDIFSSPQVSTSRPERKEEGQWNESTSPTSKIRRANSPLKLSEVEQTSAYTIRLNHLNQV